MDAVLEVKTSAGWTTREFKAVDSIHLAGAPGTEGIQFTLIGKCDDRKNRLCSFARRNGDDCVIAIESEETEYFDFGIPSPHPCYGGKS